MRSEDDSARGKLSQLRVLVANELQHLIGREPVRLFQDSRNILRRGDEDAIFRQADGRNGATPVLR
jgi:hypothetical protein